MSDRARVIRFPSGLALLHLDSRPNMVRWWCCDCDGRNGNKVRGQYIREDDVTITWEAHCATPKHTDRSRLAALVERVVEALP